MNVNPSPLEKATPKVKSKKAQLKLVVGGKAHPLSPTPRYSSSNTGFLLSVCLHILIVGLTIFFSTQHTSPSLIADSPKGAGLSLFPGMEISIDNSLSGDSAASANTMTSPVKSSKSDETPPTPQEPTPLEPVTPQAPILKAKKEANPIKKIIKPASESKPSPSTNSETIATTNQSTPNNQGSQMGEGNEAASSGGEVRTGGGGSLDIPVSYQQAIAAHLSRHKRYPEQARMRGLEGQVIISLTLGKRGDVRDLQILTSDSEILSGGAKSMVERAKPFPNIPEEMKADWITLKLPIRFNLY